MATSGPLRILICVLVALALSIVSCATAVPRPSLSPGIPPPMPARPTDPRTNGHTATVLQDGRVLVAGGYSTAPGALKRHSLASAEVYDVQRQAKVPTWCQ